ncbi:uncharacterized protein LOC122803834, partial [Protopterus annectens]|uniref:uncharacterized protein LOC122803834 n=1 Tax=Protopterus annectens TaxID=7888 RepID=UPI001CFB9C93
FVVVLVVINILYLSNKFLFYPLDGFTHWTKTDAGDGWNIENHHCVLTEAPSEKCFTSSYGWCSKIQIVDLLEEGLWEELLDIHQPDICIADWYSCRHDCGCVYEIKVNLLAADKKTAIATFRKKPPPIPQWTVPQYIKVSCVFRNYGPGVRFVKFFHRGKDTQWWAGHYGSRITNSTVIVSLQRTDLLPDIEIIEKGSAEEPQKHDDDDDDDDDDDYQVAHPLNNYWSSLEDASESSSEDSDDEFYTGNYTEGDCRLRNTDWCTCSSCEAMDDIANCYCCKEVKKILHVMEAETPTPDCITNHPGFEAVCLNQWVLHCAANGVGSEDLCLEDLSLPERYRCLSHVQFNQWCHLRKKNRVPLPSCVFHKMQSAFPLQEGKLHEFPYN